MFLERRDDLTQRHRGEGPVNMEAETGVMHHPKPGTPRTTGSHKELGERHGTDSFPEPPEGTNPADTFTLYF